MNKCASNLGKLARGVKKNFSKAERKKRSDRMIELNRLRKKKGKKRGRA